MEFKNSNGHTYEVLELVPFTKQDTEYYKESWQKYRYGLFKATSTEYIVASMVGDNSWGSGYYFNDSKQAQEYLKKLVEEYI